MLRIATWNVNSIRSRKERVIDWLVRSDVDVLALQETKCKDEQFPFDEFSAAGYEVAHVGYNQWNGVAIASRIGLADIEIGFPQQPGFSKTSDDELLPLPPVVEARAIGATCGGIRMWSLYVPNGRSLDDPHLTYKLEWLTELRNQSQQWLENSPEAAIVLAGDWNVAPTDDDVWDPSLFDGSTHTSPAERAAFNAFLDSGFADLVRPSHQGPGIYTYWDYTQLRFPKKQGMKIDYLLATSAVATRVTNAMIDRDERKGKGASDHAPVVVTLD